MRGLRTQGVAIGVGAIGGAYFGLLSCGGYAWHRHVFLGVLAVVCGITFTMARGSLPIRVALLLLVGVAYFLAQAALAPLYLGIPESFGAYMRQFLRTLEQGPC